MTDDRIAAIRSDLDVAYHMYKTGYISAPIVFDTLMEIPYLLTEIDRLNAELAASQRREQAAVEDLRNCVTEDGRRAFCKSFRKDGEWPMKCYFRGMLHTETCPDWEWRGPQEGGA